MPREQLKQLEDDLWSAADNLRANSDLRASEYGTPVLGLIFLKFADINYRRHEKAIEAERRIGKGLTEDEVESYDRALFAQKRDRVFELTLDLAINQRKWAA